MLVKYDEKTLSLRYTRLFINYAQSYHGFVSRETMSGVCYQNAVHSS